MEEYLSLDNPLNAIKIVCGTFDDFRWIPKGCEEFSEILTEKGIAYHRYEYGHYFPPHMIDQHIVPFFNENFKIKKEVPYYEITNIYIADIMY